jgi:hypothetical protein
MLDSTPGCVTGVTTHQNVGTLLAQRADTQAAQLPEEAADRRNICQLR